MPCCWLNQVISKDRGYIKQGDWVEMWSSFAADYLPSVNVKAVKATLDEKKDVSNSIKQSAKRSNTA